MNVSKVRSGKSVSEYHRLTVSVASMHIHCISSAYTPSFSCHCALQIRHRQVQNNIPLLYSIHPLFSNKNRLELVLHQEETIRSWGTLKLHNFIMEGNNFLELHLSQETELHKSHCPKNPVLDEKQENGNCSVGLENLPLLFIKEMTSKWELIAFILSIQIYSEDESCAVFATCKLYFKWIHSVFCCRIYGERGFSIESQPFLEGIVRLFKRVRNTGRKFLTSVFRNFQNEQEIPPLYCVRSISKQPLTLSQIIPWQSM